MIARLSDHQRDIAVLHSDGLRWLQIAARLGLSDRSVKKALERIMAVGRDELVRLAGTALAGDCGQRSGGSPLLAPSSAADAPPVGDVSGCGVPTAPGSLGALEGTPEQIVNRVVAYAHDHGFPTVTADTVRSANAVHGATVSGRRSDHQGPPDFAWAADISNGGAPTPEEDALARTLATAFDLTWPGAGLASGGNGEYRVQLIYRTCDGGDHFNHIHIGIRRQAGPRPSTLLPARPCGGRAARAQPRSATAVPRVRR